MVDEGLVLLDVKKCADAPESGNAIPESCSRG